MAELSDNFFKKCIIAAKKGTLKIKIHEIPDQNETKTIPKRGNRIPRDKKVRPTR